MKTSNHHSNGVAQFWWVVDDHKNVLNPSMSHLFEHAEIPKEIEKEDHEEL
jgi:hypothetical protein